MRQRSSCCWPLPDSLLRLWNNKYTDVNKWICGYVIGIGGYKTPLTDPEKRSRCLFGTGCVLFTHMCHFSQQRFLANADRSPVVKPSSGAQPPWIRLYEKKAVCLPIVLGNSNRALCLERTGRGEHGKFPPSTRHMTKNVFFSAKTMLVTYLHDKAVNPFERDQERTSPRTKRCGGLLRIT